MGILDGRRIVLTGGASGMGAASVRSFAREGARVFSMDIDADGGARVAEEAAALGGDVLFEHCDVGSPQLDDVMERGIAWLGGLDVLANVAGIERGATPQDVTEDEFEETLEPNLWATIHANQIVCRHMQEAGGGRIINYASAAGLGGMPMAPAYSVSKGGVLGWTRSIARGVGRLQHHRGGDVPGDLDAHVRGLPPPRTGGDGGDVGPDAGRHRRRSRHGPGDGVPRLHRRRRDQRASTSRSARSTSRSSWGTARTWRRSTGYASRWSMPTGRWARLPSPRSRPRALRSRRWRSPRTATRRRASTAPSPSSAASTSSPTSRSRAGGTIAALDVTHDDWEAVFKAHVRTARTSNQAAFRHMTEAGGGHIINYADIGAENGAPGEALAATAAQAVVAWTRAAGGAWLFQGVRTNIFQPGMMANLERQVIPTLVFLAGGDAPVHGVTISC